MNIHQPLEQPWIYRTAQSVFAPGMDSIVTDLLSRTIGDSSNSELKVLDVGCGPQSWLWKIGVSPIGVDLSEAYTTKYHRAGGVCVTGTADQLPFATNSFNTVLSVALLHHLPEETARTAIREMIRVTREHGRVVVFDPILPSSFWRRPLAWSICHLDRGRFIRRQNVFESKILEGREWQVERVTHSYLGTEGLLCILRKGS